jgi:hypothetical protein
MYENYEILPNAKDDSLFVIQYMLNQILNDHDDIEKLEFTGIYDKATQDAIKVLERKSLNDHAGKIDANTFNLIADEYERLNSRYF